MFTHLHTRSWYSFLAGGSSPEALVVQAVRHGMKALALTDVHGVYGVVRFQIACKHVGIKPIFGAEVWVDEAPLVLLARTLDGYANLCRLLTQAHLKDRHEPSVSLEVLAQYAADLYCLTGTRKSFLWELLDSKRVDEAGRWIRRLAGIFGDNLSIELCHRAQPGDKHRLLQLYRLSRATGVPPVATGDVLYATPEDYRRYDLLTCVRLGISVFEAQADRPRNAEQDLKSATALRRLIPYPEAFERAAQLAAGCNVDLLPGYITPPAARIPAPYTARQYIHLQCKKAFERRYQGHRRAEAAAQLKKELDVIGRLELDDYFLMVREVVEEARQRGIRCAGRGSAANSIVAYLLGITGVDPIEHKLLFERFLHEGRKGTPDIDVDFDSERRDEVIAWIEERFGIEQTAMTATLITYRARSALRDTAKALGWPMEQVNRMSKAVSPHAGRHLSDYRVQLAQIVGDAPLLDTLLTMAEDLLGCPRHLGLHSGGMVLSRRPLYHFTPVQVSANGVKVVQFDKDDVESLGLVKLDVLGLRMLATLSESIELVLRHSGRQPDIDELPLDDVPTFNLIRSGKTLGAFQIESQGQLHLLAQHQPDNFGDLINEIAIFRPGPIKGGMVHPFVRRRRGQEPVAYDHPLLEPVLKSTYGVIIFQEQVLEVVHRFAALPLDEADQFRRLMSRFRDAGEMEEMRDRFVSGAMGQGVPEDTAHKVFDKVSGFVGYGFCKSHAAAFAKTVYQSTYLKRHYPAAYMAAVMQHRPGMYSLMTLEQEARRCGVDVLTPEINRSGIRYDLELGPRGYVAIRKPLVAVASLSADDARRIVWERLQGPFQSVEDLYLRVALDINVFRNLARSGALDDLAGTSRRALWEIGLLARRQAQPGTRAAPALFDMPLYTEDDIPELPPLSEADRLSWDYQTNGSARYHPMALLRRTLNELEIRPICTCYAFGRSIPFRRSERPPVITIAGLSVLRQRPPTANGVFFLTLEDETGFIQCVIFPKALNYLDHVLSRGALIIRGMLQVMGNWRGIVVTQAWQLNGIFGGYEGHPSYAGGRDRLVTESAFSIRNSEAASAARFQ